jgi:uncharacterized membrane protein (DUF485 family)
MLHEPVGMRGKDPASQYKTRLGVWMLLGYAAIYVGFVAINLMAPALMETAVLFDLNLAVVYGFGLIALALVLAIIYNRMCLVEERRLAPQAKE